MYLYCSLVFISALAALNIWRFQKYKIIFHNTNHSIIQYRGVQRNKNTSNSTRNISLNETKINNK